jgi:hypothetical protein
LKSNSAVKGGCPTMGSAKLILKTIAKGIKKKISIHR